MSPHLYRFARIVFGAVSRCSDLNGIAIVKFHLPPSSLLIDSNGSEDMRSILLICSWVNRSAFGRVMRLAASAVPMQLNSRL